MTLRIIAGKYKGKALKTPKGSSTRPSQSMLREALFNICQNNIEAARVLDLFAGSGAIGFEALSRGAAHVTFVEKNRQAILCIKHNIEELQVQEQTTLIPLSAEAALNKFKDPFDLIYIDPPYEKSALPFLKILAEKQLLHPQGTIFLEERGDTDCESILLHVKSRRHFGAAHLIELERTL